MSGIGMSVSPTLLTRPVLVSAASYLLRAARLPIHVGLLGGGRAVSLVVPAGSILISAVSLRSGWRVGAAPPGPLLAVASAARRASALPLAPRLLDGSASLLARKVALAARWRRDLACAAMGPCAAASRHARRSMHHEVR